MAPRPEMQPQAIPLPPSPPVADVETSVETSGITRTISPRPRTPCRASSPDSTSTAASTSATTLPYRPRNRSPLSRGHIRSQTASGSMMAPPMQRAKSSPGVESGRLGNPSMSGPRPSSPLGPSGRRRSPLRSAPDDAYSSNSFWDRSNLEPNIPEHAELDTTVTLRLTSSTGPDEDPDQLSPLPNYPYTFPRARRRPSSPLHHVSSTSSLPGLPTTPTSSTGSPLLAAQKYANEPYPTFNPYSSLSSVSSVPSTPTSFRSRSPSISSLETIPDTPDAEEAARLEAEEYAKLGAVVNGEDCEVKEPGELKRRSSMEMRGFGFGTRNKPKRWSVCGAERRQDLDLETIWED